MIIIRASVRGKFARNLQSVGSMWGVRRLRRIIFNVLALLSLLLCIATVVLWVRSYWRHDSAWRESGYCERGDHSAERGYWYIDSGRGWVSFQRVWELHKGPSDF